MDILTTINKILVLIERSQGKKISMQSGEEYYFIVNKKYNSAQIEAYEKKLSIDLPNEYKTFLNLIGSCKLFFDEYELGIVFHGLEEIENITNKVFIGLQSPFPTIFLIASNLNNGDMIGYNLNKKSEKSLSIYSISEEYPENWINYNNFISLSYFLTKLIVSDGEDYYL